MLRLAYLSAPSSSAQQENVDGNERRTAISSQSMSGHRNVMTGSGPRAWAAFRRPPVGCAACGDRQTSGSCREVIIRGQLERVHTRAAERRAERLLAPLGRRGEALPERAVVGVDKHLLARLGVLDDQ